MSLSAGSLLGPYKILAPLGSGGMGEVYKARDTRLERMVAIKTSREKFSERFEQEARAIAALNHPHICTLYDVGPDHLVMEYVDGGPLKGPLPVEEALRYAIQIADALDHAHRHGITHRDLKPANILLTKSGVKLLDFGLAKVAQASAGDPDATQTMGLTQAGAILGTPQYMAPEQVEGKPADARSDIFSFGAVFYELITGRKAFEGKSAASVMAAVLREEPAHSPEISGPLEPVLARCLAKDPDDRWQHAGDLRWALERAGKEKRAEARPATPRAWMAAAVALGAALAGALAFVAPRQPAAETLNFQLSVPPPDGATFTGETALSPDGRLLAFTAASEGVTTLWVRPLESTAARSLGGTEGAAQPFWSPDNRSLGFFAKGKLKRVELAGGPPETVCDVSVGAGGAWSSEGVIIFAPGISGGLQRVAASGGAPAPLTALDDGLQETSHRFPQFLPDGRRFLYWARAHDEKNVVYLSSLDDPGSRSRILESGSRAEYMAPSGDRPGQLLWVRDATLTTQRWNAERQRLEGEAVKVAERVGMLVPLAGTARFSTSQKGVVVYLGGDDSRHQMKWLDRGGRPLAPAEDGSGSVHPRLSPDGRSVALARDVNNNTDIWIYEFGRRVMKRLTFEPGLEIHPVWSPDGRQVAFSAGRQKGMGVNSVLRKDTTGAGHEETLKQDQHVTLMKDWSRDGRHLLYEELHPETRWDLWVLPLEKDRKPVPVLRTAASESGGRFSADGRWIAYTSDESGRSEVYVQAFPSSGGKWQISTNGGTEPRWRGDGKELFFTSGSALMAASVRTSGRGLETETPRELFRARMFDYDVAADGQRFLVIAPAEQAERRLLTVITNLQAVLPR